MTLTSFSRDGWRKIGCWFHPTQSGYVRFTIDHRQYQRMVIRWDVPDHAARDVHKLLEGEFDLHDVEAYLSARGIDGHVAYETNT